VARTGAVHLRGQVAEIGKRSRELGSSQGERPSIGVKSRDARSRSSEVARGLEPSI
jgi:hypothetical protein